MDTFAFQSEHVHENEILKVIKAVQYQARKLGSRPAEKQEKGGGSHCTDAIIQFLVVNVKTKSHRVYVLIIQYVIQGSITFYIKTLSHLLSAQKKN